MASALFRDVGLQTPSSWSAPPRVASTDRNLRHEVRSIMQRCEELRYELDAGCPIVISDSDEGDQAPDPADDDSAGT